MRMRQMLQLIVGLAVFVTQGSGRDERGLSQSAENAILLVGAVTIAGTVIALLGTYVVHHMPK